ELNEIYELKLGMLEARLLSEKELIQRGAYFVSINGKPTYHYHLCTGGGLKLPADSSVRLQSFLGSHQFKTSYATHGLFPYRGKYHPQMIKALMNVMGLHPGSTVLDPMAGSGTTAVEAGLMGINSIAIDVSPFCTFLTNTKFRALAADISDLEPLLQNAEHLGKIYNKLGKAATATKVQDAAFQPRGISRTAFDILALAYMDARGYAERSSRKNQNEFFKDILAKYLDIIERFQKASRELPLTLGSSQVLLGDARELRLESDSIDGVIFSPPYSFAVDYLANDAPHLAYLGYNLEAIRPRMIGLNGGRGAGKVEQYFEDMSCVLGEVARVLKPSRYCVIMVGSNSQQLARLLRIDPASPEATYSIEQRLIKLAEEKDLTLELAIRRLIVGMANSMREEHILIFRKGERDGA
ncbi:MAG: TRM11 family SAM-dependent methyltransferase, partial [Gammaproteobacteria bacterium]